MMVRQFDPTFVPSKSDLNALRGLIVGEVEEGFDGTTGGSGQTEVGNAWIWKNIPNTTATLNRLMDAGWVWEHEWSKRDCSTGIAPEAEKWCIAHLGMPDDLRSPEGAKIVAEKIEPLFKRKGGMALKPTDLVRQTSYTRDEAMEARLRIRLQVAAGQISKRSAAAYKAHISRRTA